MPDEDIYSLLLTASFKPEIVKEVYIKFMNANSDKPDWLAVEEDDSEDEDEDD